MNFILSTYSFFPYAAGGTEVYTKALAWHLQQHGHKVLIVAGWDGNEKAGEQIIFDNEDVKAGSYQSAGLAVLGVQLKRQDAEAVYSNENKQWTHAFVHILSALEWGKADYLIMNGISTVSGVSLYTALEQLHAAIKMCILVHTPFVCARADMMFSGNHQRCQQVISPVVCGACFTANRTKLPFGVSKIITRLTDNLLFAASALPALLRQPYLLKKKIAALQLLNDKADKWIVFSMDMQSFLLKQPFTTAAKLQVIRHGIDKTIFYENDRISRGLPVDFLYAGRFEKIKGVKILCDAWLQLKEAPSDRRLFLAGNWNDTALGKEVHGLLSKRTDVVFMDSMTQEQLADMYRQVNCVIIPSQWVETGPLVFHEAIECGCDVITTDMGGQAELAALYHSKAFIFDHLDKESLHRLLLQYEPGATGGNKPVSAAQHFSFLLNSLAIAG